MTDNKRKLYDVLSKDYDLGTFEQFSSGLEDEEKRKKAYEAAKANYDLGDYDKFSADLGFSKQAEPVVEDQTQSVRQNAGVEGLNFNDEPQVEPQAPEVPETPQEQRTRLEEAMRPYDETVGPLAPTQRKEYDLLMQQYKSNPLVQLDERISAAEKEAEEYGRKAHEIANKYRAEVGYQPYTTSWGMVGNMTDDRIEEDPEYRRYMVAENNKRQEARQLRHIRDGKSNNFWTNIGDVFADPNTWTLGFWSATEGRTRMDAEKNEDDESSQILLQSIVGRQIADAESEEERHFWGRAGRLAGNMIPFAIQIATTKGLFGGIGAGVKGAVTSKLGTSVVARATGALAGDLAYGAAMAGTVGSGQVIGNTIQNMSGEIVKGEDGNYHALDGYYKPDAEGDFQDAEGNRYSFEETPSWFSAGYKAFMGQTLEYSTEMFGDHLQHGIGRLIAKGAKKSGKQALHPAVEAIVKNWDVNPEGFGLKAASRDAMRSTGAQLTSGMVKYLNVAGIQGYPFEGLEEEANIIFGAFFGTGEKWMDFSPLWDGETQADIWGGMFFSAGLMQAAPFVGSVGIEAYKAGKAKAYTKIATKLEAASDNAAVTLGERWEAIKAQIDDTDNASIPAFMRDVRNSEEYSDEEKLAIGLYVANLEKFRGFNQGTMAQAREAIEQGSDVGVYAEEPQRLSVETEGQIDGAYIAGYNSPEEQQNDIAKSFDIAQKRLKDATGLDAISDEAVGEFLRDPNRTPEQKQAVIDYKMAYEAKQGMFQHVRDEIFRKIAVSNRTIDRNTSKTDGLIHPVTLKVGDRRAYIVDGNAVMTEDGTSVDHTKSMHDLLLRDAETGEIFFASIDQVLSVEDALDPLAEKEVVAEQIRQSIGQDAANRIDGILPFNLNDIYDLADMESGQMFKIQVVANEDGLVDNGDGTVNVVLNPKDGQPATISQMPKEQIQSLVDNARYLLLMSWANEIDKARAARQRMQHTVDEDLPEDLPEGLSQTPQAEAQSVEEKPSIPVDDKGRKQYMQAPKELAYEDIYSDEDFESDEEAYSFINGKVKRAKEALDRQQGAVGKIKPENYDTPSEYRAAKNKALEAAKPFQDTYDFWKGVLDLADADIAAAKEREARAARMEEMELEEPQSLEAVVANAFRGMQHGLNKEDFKRETGMGEAELKKFFPFWAKKGHGLSVQAFAESIIADDTSGLIPMIGDAEQYDTQAVRDAIIEVFRSASKPSDIYDYTRNLNLQMKAEEARFNAEAEERARYEAEQAAAAQAAEPVVEEPAVTVVEQPETSTVLENEPTVQTPLQQTIEAAREEVDVEPTEAQKKAGNYKMGHIKIDGREITIENPKGSVRKGKDANGKEWQTEMHHDYGYLRKTEGVDADPIDIFLSDNPEEGNVFVVDQVDPQTGQFDEHKVMYGFNSLEEAKAAYLSNYEEGWQGLGSITEVSREEFKKWIESSHRKTKPFAEYKSVKPVQESPFEFDTNSAYGKDGLRYCKIVNDFILKHLKDKGNAWLRKQLEQAKGAERIYFVLDNDGQCFGIKTSVEDIYQSALNADKEDFHVVRITGGEKFNYAPGWIFANGYADYYDESGLLKQSVKADAINNIKKALGEVENVEAAPEVVEATVPATLEEAKAALHNATRTSDDKPMFPEVAYVSEAIREMDVAGRELMQAETTKSTRDGIIGPLKNYIDKLAEQFSARLAAYNSPEAVISTANQKADELLKKAESEQMDPYDFEDAMNAVVEDVKILLRKMRYDKPSDYTGRYDLDTMDTSGYREDVAALLKGASEDVLAQLYNKKGDIPFGASDVVRAATEASRNRNAAEAARQMYFNAHPEMPSATPTGKFDIWKFTLKDANKPALGGVFHDKGYKVASDTHILVALKEAYPKENEGKILDKKKAEIKGNFPKWRDLIKEGTASNIDVAHLASFVEGVKQHTGKDFKDAKIVIPVEGQMRLFSAPLLENFLRAVQKIDGKLSYRLLGESGKSMMLQAEGKDGYALIISAWNNNWTSPMFHFYATPQELERVALEREQAHTVAEAQSFVTGRPVEEIEAEQKAAQKPWTPQEKWDAAEKALAEAKSAEDRREAIRLRKEALEDKMQVIADAEHPVVVTTHEDIVDVLTQRNVPQYAISEVVHELDLENPMRDKMRGFLIPDDGIYIVTDDVKSLEDGVSTYVHERQHQITENGNLAETLMSLPGFDRGNILQAMRKWKASRYYERQGTRTVADEFLSMAMELAYQCETPEVFEQELRKAGIENEEIINFVKNIDNEQRGSQSLSSARNVTLFQDSEQGSRSENDRDKGPVSGGDLGQEGVRPAEGSESSTRRSSRTGEIKAGPSRQIEDFGEKIAGARKDELRNLSKTLEDATEETFVALPLAKAFKRPNTKKLIENGIISQEDAALVDAVSWLILGSPKPVKLKDRSYKARRRDEEIVTWAKDQARRAKVLLDYINADAAGKQAIIESLADIPEDIKASEDYNRNRIVEMNRGWKELTVGELYPLNPIYVAYRIFQNTGYDPDVNGRIKFPVIKCDSMGKSYTVKSGSYGYEQAQSVEDAINQASYLIQLQMGADDLDHPASAFRVRGIHDKKVGSGRFIVSYITARRSRLSAEQKEFDNKEAALEFARKQYKDRPESEIESNIYEPQVWAPATSFKIVGLNAATGEEYDLEGKYDSPEEAREAIDSKHEELNVQMNQAIQKANEAKGESGKKRDKLYVAFYHENGKSSYGVWADDKGFWQGSALLRGGFQTSKEARAYMEEHRAEFEGMLKDMAKKRSEFVFFDGDAQSRKGKDYRQGKNVGEEEYKAFGFRGVQFGNWANDADRQAALNNTYDSFMNLAELLGVSPAALSLNGELGLAFGARGSGSANAHYESDEVVINLTKTRGAGSLAHEWWHALDNYFARRGGIAHGFITASRIPGARPELQQAFDELSKGIRASDYGKRSAQRGDYWKSDWEMTARLFAEWLERRIAEKGESDHFLVRGVTDEDMERWQDVTYAFYKARMKGLDETPMSFDEFKKTPESLVGYPYPTTEEIKTTLGPLMQKVVDTISEKSEDGKTVLFSKTISPITTYHGSGASFNQFDLQFLGSGEGTDVYGPGIYVSEVDGIAKSYANVAAGNRLAEVRDGIDRQEARLQEIRAGYPAKIAYHEEAAARMEGTKSADIHKKFADNYRYMLETGDYKYDAEAREIQDNIKARQQMLSDEGKRHLYTVEIPGDNGHNYLTFGEEVPVQDAMRIKAALRARLLADPNSGYNAKVIRELDDELNMAFRDIFGDQLLGTLDAYLGNDGVGFKSTQFLHDLGFVGIKVDTNYQDPNGDHTANNYVIFDPKDARITEHIRFSKLNQWPVEDREQSHVRFSKVTDKKTLAELEKGETEIGYRNVVLNEDGTLGSPMADKLGKKGQKSVSTIPFAFDEWEQSDEHPEMATDEGKINLIKPDKLGNVDAVDYNPYIHIRPTLLNKQFTGAWKRPNLVYVAVEYPTSELTSGYHAEKAAKSVGRHEWNGGDLILSRYDKPVRIVSWDEVADEWVKEFKDRGVTFDIVPPGLLPVLVERGLDILPPKTAAGAPARAAYEHFSRRDNKVRFSKITPEQDQEYLAAVEAGDMEKAQRMVDEAAEQAFAKSKVRDSKGKLVKVYHGTMAQFNEFDKDMSDSTNEFGKGMYFSDAKSLAERYASLDKNPDYDHEWRVLEKFEELGKKMGLDLGYEDTFNNEYIGLYNQAYDEVAKEGRVIAAYINIENPFVQSEGEIDKEEPWKANDGIIDNAFAQRHEGLEGTQYIVFNANQIKSAEPVTKDEDGKVVPLSKRFDSGRKDIRFSKTNETERIFISNAEKAAENIKMEKATPEQWLKMLEKDGGLKAGEDKWLGLSDWLRASDKKTITKQEVLDFIRKNEIVIEEENYGELELSQLQSEFDQIYDDIIDGLGEENEDELELYQVVMSPAERAWDELRSRYSGGDDFDMAFELDDQMKISVSDEDRAGFFLGTKPINSTRLDYSSAGLDNKREIALTVPTIEPWNESDEIHFGDAGEGRVIAWIRFGDTRAKRKETPERKAHIALEAELESKYGRTFMGPESPITAEERDAFNESWAKANKSESFFGEKVLFIDEIQSKRHQEGRENGYIKDSEEKRKALREERERLFKKYNTHSMRELERLMTSEEALHLDELDKAIVGVPEAPFEKNWHELAFKRMLRLAAEEGYDKVAWTTGEQQAERYNLSTSVDEIRVIDAGMGEHEIRGFKNGENVLNRTVTDGEKGLASYIGKDMARKAYATLHEGDQTYLVNDTYASFKGDDLRIGGEGMKGFYDDILPRFVNKYGKKWGVKVYDQELPAIEQTAHVIDVTPEMKESVKRGQVMFSKVETPAWEGIKFSEDETIQSNIENGLSALERISRGEEEITDAMRREELAELGGTAEIAFIWGTQGHLTDAGRYKGGEGFVKIIDKHGIDDAIKVVETIAKGTIGKPYGVTGGERVDIDLRDHHTTVSLFRNGVSKSWVLTGYTIDSNTDAKGRGSDLTNATQNDPIRTRAELGAALKSTANIQRIFDTEKPSGKKPLFSKLERPVEEIVNEGKQKVSNETDEARAHLNERMRAIDDNLAKLRMAASAQREYDRETVRSITDLAKDLLKNGALSDVTRQEIEKMLTVTRWATGRKDLQGAVQTIMDLMVANQLRHSENVLKSLLKIRGSKVDARGVEVQGQLDAPGQRMMQAFKTAMDMSLEAIDKHIAGAEERLDSEDDTIKAAAGDELVGLQMARKYVEDIKSSIEEEKGIKNELRYAAEDRRARKMHPASYREFVESSEEALRQNRMERIAAYNELIDGLSRMLYDSIARGTAFREAEKARIEQIHHFANSDLEGRADEEHGNKNDRLANNGILRFLLKPLATFDQMLRHFGSKSVNGEGYLWNHFMRGWVDANNAEFKGLQAATKALDAKVSEVFGRKMRWSDLYAVERTMPTVDVKFWDGGKMKEHKLTQGNLLYIYMVDKMSDGRMKLRRMGIEEAHVEAIKNQMDPRFLELADWLQSEFLVGIRNKYNKVHVRMFGTPMAAIENYFPLKILANARVREVDMSTPDMDGTTPATITGSIIKRRRNALALDVIGTDAFSVVIEHLQQMEHWAAFAPFNRDLNTLLSYKKFRNRVQNMAGIYGAGSVIWENFRKSAEIAAGVYHPAVSKDSIDSSAVNIAKGVTAAKISFRVYTAIKQLLSMPAYISDANIGLLGKSLASPWKSWNWAMKELPGFEKRWRSRQAGDTRLMKTDSDWKLWRHNVVETASRLGMSPNAFVDALTVAIGAKAMYDTRFKKYYHDGYTREQAEKRAKQDATILFNETQQSNENAFLSAMQLDRTWVSVALTVFRNSSMGFQRQLVDAVRNLGHKMQPGYKEKAIEFMTKQMVRDGIEEEDARAAAERNYKRSTFRDSMRVALFGFIMQFAWNLGAYLPYLIAGGDDDDKKKMLQDAARHGIVGGMVEGLSGGSVISEAANMLASGESVANYNPSLMPVTSDIHKIIKLMSYDQVAAVNEIANLLVQIGVGVNPQTVTNIGVAIYDACHGDLETSREAVLLLMRTLNVPESQTDKVLMDGIDFTAEKGLDMTISEFASRYADYKIRRNTAALGWMYSDEAREKRVNTYEKRFIKDAEEAKRTRGNEIDKAYYEYVDTEYKEVDKTLRELRSGLKSASMSGDQLGAMEYAEMLNNFMATPEYVKYAQVHGYQNAIKRLTSMLKDVNPKNRDQVEDQLLQLKKQMVTQIQKDNK